jgi:hypothetical protein
MYCEKCGNKASSADAFCGHCGAKLEPLSGDEQSSPPEENQTHEDIPNTPISTNTSFFDKYKLENIDLETAENHIRNAWIAGLITLGVTAILLLMGENELSSWADVILIAILTFGVYKKNVISAVIFFVYFLISKIIVFSEAGTSLTFAGIIFSFLFLNYYYLGILGTIRYKKLTSEKKHQHGKHVATGIIIGIVGTIISLALLYSDSEPTETTLNTDTPEQILYKADYSEGYKAGYADGRSQAGQLGDNYIRPASEERRSPYVLGYFEGFVTGCREGNFDCRAVEQKLDEYYTSQNNDTNNSNVQLIPSNSI